MRRPTKRASVLAFVAIGFGIAALAIEACVDEAFLPGQFACDPRGKAECPPGLLCAADGVCRSSQIAIRDASVEDAPPAADVVVDAPPSGDACAVATWTTSPAGRAPSALAFGPEGRLFVGGTAGDAGWVAEMDPCDGGVVRESTFDTPSDGFKPDVQDMLVTDDEVVVTGTSGGAVTGIFVRFAKTNLTQKELRSFPGTGIVGLDRIARLVDGSYVLGGAREIFAGDQNGWIIRIGAGGGGSCNTTAGTGVVGLLPSGADAIVFTNPASETGVDYQTLGDKCELGPVQSASFGGVLGGVSFVTGTPAAPYVVGAYGPKAAAGGFEYGLVAKIVGPTLELAAPYDPNPGKADYAQIALVDGDKLFVGALQNASLSGGTPTLLRYALPLGSSAKPNLTTGVFGARLPIFKGMKTSPTAADDGLYVAGPIPGNRADGVVTRCSRTSGCK